MTWTAEGEERLDRFLAQRLPTLSRSRISEWIGTGAVTVDGKPAKPSLRLKAGQVIRAADEPADRPAHDLTPAEIPLEVVFEDEAILVVNKPRGMATHPAPSLKEPSLVNALLARGQSLSQGGPSWRPGIVHRLDKDTTGLIVVAKTDQAHQSLARQFERKEARREYVAVVSGDFPHERLLIDAPLARDPKNRLLMTVQPEGRRAVTHVQRLARLEVGSLLAIQLETGRTHQIRAHLKYVGHPVLGDPLYGRPSPLPLQLHALQLTLQHPQTLESVAFWVEPPDDFVGRDFVLRAPAREGRGIRLE